MFFGFLFNIANFLRNGLEITLVILVLDLKIYV